MGPKVGRGSAAITSTVSSAGRRDRDPRGIHRRLLSGANARSDAPAGGNGRVSHEMNAHGGMKFTTLVTREKGSWHDAPYLFAGDHRWDRHSAGELGRPEYAESVIGARTRDVRVVIARCITWESGKGFTIGSTDKYSNYRTGNTN